MELTRGLDDVAGFREEEARVTAAEAATLDRGIELVRLLSDEAGTDEIAGAAELFTGSEEAGGGASLEVIPPPSGCDEGAGCSELVPC